VHNDVCRKEGPVKYLKRAMDYSVEYVEHPEMVFRGQDNVAEYRSVDVEYPAILHSNRAIAICRS
jgi:hypothetical protein